LTKPLQRAVDPLTWEPLLLHQLRLRAAISPKIACMATLEVGKDIGSGTWMMRYGLAVGAPGGEGLLLLLQLVELRILGLIERECRVMELVHL
jgi:hypothetical protein